jgi:hypothetical protein
MTGQLRRGADAPPVSLSMVFNLIRKKSLEQHEQIRTRTGLPLVAKAIGVVTLPNAALNKLAGVDARVSKSYRQCASQRATRSWSDMNLFFLYCGLIVRQPVGAT